MTDEASSEEIEVTLPQIRCVDLADLASVIEHRIEEHFGSVSHYVRFRNGGVLRFAHALSGELLELNGENLNVRIGAEGDIAFGQCAPTVRDTSGT